MQQPVQSISINVWDMQVGGRTRYFTELGFTRRSKPHPRFEPVECSPIVSIGPPLRHYVRWGTLSPALRLGGASARHSPARASVLSLVMQRHALAPCCPEPRLSSHFVRNREQWTPRASFMSRKVIALNQRAAGSAIASDAKKRDRPMRADALVAKATGLLPVEPAAYSCLSNWSMCQDDVEITELSYRSRPAGSCWLQRHEYDW